jgi:hypothetical protein
MVRENYAALFSGNGEWGIGNREWEIGNGKYVLRGVGVHSPFAIRHSPSRGVLVRGDYKKAKVGRRKAKVAVAY